MVTALSDNEVKEILYHEMPNLWRKKMTKQGHNFQDRSIQEITGFLEIRVEYLETPAPPSAVRILPPRNRELSPLRILTKVLQKTKILNQKEILLVLRKVWSFYGIIYYT